MADKNQTITSFKSFNKDLQCRGFQYEIGKTYHHEGEVKACGSGFHACEYPLDVFGYYAPGESRFATVEQSGDLSRKDDGDSKVSSRSIRVKAEIDIPFLVKASIEYTTSKCEPVDKKSPAFSDKDRGQAIATGYKSASSATGYKSASSATGNWSASSATGNWSASTTTGHYSESQIIEKEDCFGVAVGVGYQNKARAPEGSAIVLAFRGGDGEIIHIRASKVGENGVKANTWYQLSEDGEFVEVKEPQQ